LQTRGTNFASGVGITREHILDTATDADGRRIEMNADEIVRSLRENAEWCDANEYEVPICMGDNQRESADLIESLQAQLAESQRRERAAAEDLKISAYCRTCAKGCGLCEALSKRDHEGGCKDYEWRGPQEAGEGARDEN
jgi:hypothetical protein